MSSALRGDGPSGLKVRTLGSAFSSGRRVTAGGFELGKGSWELGILGSIPTLIKESKV